MPWSSAFEIMLLASGCHATVPRWYPPTPRIETSSPVLPMGLRATWNSATAAPLFTGELGTMGLGRGPLVWPCAEVAEITDTAPVIAIPFKNARGPSTLLFKQIPLSHVRAYSDTWGKGLPVFCVA